MRMTRILSVVTACLFATIADAGEGTRVVLLGTGTPNAYPDRWSQLTLLLFLSDDYVGGATRFHVSADDTSRPAQRNGQAKIVDLRTPLGAALCFPHGTHPQHCVHSSEKISSGRKYIIRSDVLFEL